MPWNVVSGMSRSMANRFPRLVLRRVTGGSSRAMPKPIRTLNVVRLAVSRSHAVNVAAICSGVVVRLKERNHRR